MASKDASDREAEEAEAVDGARGGPQKSSTQSLASSRRKTGYGAGQIEGAAALRVWKKNFSRKKSR